MQLLVSVLWLILTHYYDVDNNLDNNKDKEGNKIKKQQKSVLKPIGVKRSISQEKGDGIKKEYASKPKEQKSL